MNRKGFSHLIQQFFVTFGHRELETYDRLIFKEIHPRYFRAETTVILLVDADTALSLFRSTLDGSRTGKRFAPLVQMAFQVGSCQRKINISQRAPKEIDSSNTLPVFFK